MLKRLLLALAAIAVCSARAEAGHFCEHCGCHRNCKKVCRLVCEKKKETKTEYDIECEDFCIPGPSRKLGVKTECDCNGRHHTILWQPKCAKVHTRKKLVKKEVTKEVPKYKWEVDEYCCVCGHWIKVERDKEKDKDDGKPKDGDSEKGQKSPDGGAEKKRKASDSDRPNPPKADRKSQDAGDEGDGNSQPELLPPPQDAGDRQTLSEPWPENYRDYYFGVEPATASQPLPSDREAVPATSGAISETRFESPAREPRRLFFGLFGR